MTEKVKSPVTHPPMKIYTYVLHVWSNEVPSCYLALGIVCKAPLSMLSNCYVKGFHLSVTCG